MIVTPDDIDEHLVKKLFAPTQEHFVLVVDELLLDAVSREIEPPFLVPFALIAQNMHLYMQKATDYKTIKGKSLTDDNIFNMVQNAYSCAWNVTPAKSGSGVILKWPVKISWNE